MTLLQFTRPDGKAIFINPDHVVRVSPETRGTSLTLLTGGDQVVVEKPEVVVRMLRNGM